MTDSIPRRIDRGPPSAVLVEAAKQVALGITYYREPIADTHDDPEVYSCEVRRVRPNLYRAVIVYRRIRPEGSYIFAAESSRETVTHWLTERGLPTLRLIRADF